MPRGALGGFLLDVGAAGTNDTLLFVVAAAIPAVGGLLVIPIKKVR